MVIGTPFLAPLLLEWPFSHSRGSLADVSA
jgi:hypothetical protein